MANQPHVGLRRLVYAAGYSWAGLKAAWQNEEAFRVEVLLCAIFLPAALWLGENGVEKALLIGSLLLMVITELVNSAVEAIVDRIGSERHQLSGRAKDIASATVFIAVLNAVLIWLLVLLD